MSGRSTVTPTDATDESHEESNIQSHQCPPLESCTEPCKVVEEDHHHHFTAKSAVQNEENDQSEGVRCSRCQCPRQEETLSTENHHINSTSTMPCDAKEGGLCGRSAIEQQSDEEEEREQWGKSVREDGPSAASSRCPPVDCHHPCYIYRVASGDCPRCICSPKLPLTEQSFF